MSFLYLFFLLTVGASVGFLSGLLGIGGGIVMFPLLHYGPQLLGLAPIPVKEITGLTMAQGFFASLSAVFIHRSQGFVNKPLVLTLGASLFFSSLAGSIFSKFTADRSLLFIFGLLALAASGMMLLPRSYARDNETEDRVLFSRAGAIAIGLTIGFLVGMVGQGGAFIIIPLMLYVLKIPLRVTLGSTLAIGLFSATAGLIGKVATGQVPFLMAVCLLLGAIPAARVGSRVSRLTRTEVLRWLLSFIICATAIKIWMDIL